MGRLLLFCGILLTLFAGCSDANKLDLRGPVLLQNKIPESLLTCPESPAVPEANSQRSVAGYIVSLHGAHRDCKANLDAVGGILRRQDAAARETQGDS